MRVGFFFLAIFFSIPPPAEANRTVPSAAAIRDADFLETHAAIYNALMRIRPAVASTVSLLVIDGDAQRPGASADAQEGGGVQLLDPSPRTNPKARQRSTGLASAVHQQTELHRQQTEDDKVRAEAAAADRARAWEAEVARQETRDRLRAEEREARDRRRSEEAEEREKRRAAAQLERDRLRADEREARERRRSDAAAEREHRIMALFFGGAAPSPMFRGGHTDPVYGSPFGYGVPSAPSYGSASAYGGSSTHGNSSMTPQHARGTTHLRDSHATSMMATGIHSSAATSNLSRSAAAYLVDDMEGADHVHHGRKRPGDMADDFF